MIEFQQLQKYFGLSIMALASGFTLMFLNWRQRRLLKDNNCKTSTSYQQLIGNTPLIKLSKLSALPGRTILVRGRILFVKVMNDSYSSV